ncbi:MAG: threonylcarbamoyl-AMP synthase [Clostridia bacterium]|nr:threonylcarbamoyl-AMP synthase [Clostridia bacterium]
MKTEVIRADADGIRRGAKLIRAGEVVGMPTETVYGLAANALDENAVKKIFAAKGRPADNPLIVHIASEKELEGLVTRVPEMARALMRAYWPGPMTLIMPKTEAIPAIVTAGGDTVGIRMPESEAARALIRESGCPIAAPSANTSGKPSPTTAQHVLSDMNGKIPLILDAGACGVGVESTVIDTTGEEPVVLRPGAITPEMIRRTLGSVEVDEHVMKPLAEGEAVRSPGMKYRHYAPSARLTLFEGEHEQVKAEMCARYDAALKAGGKPAILGNPQEDYGGRLVFALGHDGNAEDAAVRIFACLRELDDAGITAAFCETIPLRGMGLAVMNRLGRAAGFNIEKAGENT